MLLNAMEFQKDDARYRRETLGASLNMVGNCLLDAGEFAAARP
jgi:hypothetical protein